MNKHCKWRNWTFKIHTSCSKAPIFQLTQDNTFLYMNYKTTVIIECTKTYNIKVEPAQIFLVRGSIRNMARPTGNWKHIETAISSGRTLLWIYSWNNKDRGRSTFQLSIWNLSVPIVSQAFCFVAKWAAVYCFLNSYQHHSTSILKLSTKMRLSTRRGLEWSICRLCICNTNSLIKT